MNFSIQLPPITKKNSQQIYRNRRTNKPFISQSDAYKRYEADAGYFLRPVGIDYPVNVKAVYYMPDDRKVDIANLHSALHDTLKKHSVVKDDNCKIIASTDGSRVEVDKDNPRTEIEIRRIGE